MKLKKRSLIIFGAITLFLMCSCAQNAEPSLQNIYGSDADYFAGLTALREQNQKDAIRLFNRAISKGSKYVARRALEQKAKLGNVQERLKCCKELVEKYKDDEALLFACREYFEDSEYALIISSTENISLQESDNQLVKYRLDAMKEKNDTRYNKAVYDWFTLRHLSAEHYVFFTENTRDDLDMNLINTVDGTETTNTDKPDSVQQTVAGELSEIQSSEMLSLEVNFVLSFRITIYNKSYNASFEMLPQIKDLLLTSKRFPLTAQLVTDMGRACMYGSTDNLKNAAFFKSLSESEFSKDNQIKFYSLIYAGRIYDKSSKYITQASNNYLAAMELSENVKKTSPSEKIIDNANNDYDLALWFLLNTYLKESPERAISELKKYCSKWSDPLYFADFFDALSVRIFSSGKWELVPTLYKTIDGYADAETIAKFAYLTGRLYQEKYIYSDDKTISEKAFRRAFELDSTTYVYYKLLAAKQLNLSKQEIDAELKQIGNPLAPKQSDPDAERLLTGYAAFGFQELVYPEWQRLFSSDEKLLGVDSVVEAASFLRNCANGKNDYYAKSLRMIARTTNTNDGVIPLEAFKLLYPQNFKSSLEKYSKEFSVDEYVMYALIRTESFFDPNAKSSVGAIGLSQLMETTAVDCALQLNLSDYELTDADTNIHIGTYYFSTLVDKLDDSQILALFAYNAGRTRVRRWLKSSRIELGNRRDLPSDLFLETIPFNETRGYGRSVISAAAMYGWLYYDKNPADIITSMMPQ